MLQAIVDYVRPPRIGDLAALQRFLGGEASYLAQRSTYEFSRNTLAWFGQWAFGDDKFNDAFRLCRWESFAAVLADMMVMTLAKLRERAPSDSDHVVDGLVALFEAILTDYPLPAHRPNGWGDLVQGLRIRLGQSALASALEPADIARTAARRVYEVVPVHSANTAADYEVIEGAIRFGMVSFDDRLRRRLHTDAIIESFRHQNRQAAEMVSQS